MPVHPDPDPEGPQIAVRRVVAAEALRTLSRPHREILTETVVQNRSVNEAADVLGIPLATVKTRVYYALRALRIVLEETGGESGLSH